MVDNVITAKSVAMCVLFTSSMLLGTLPLGLSKLFQANLDSKKNIYVQLLLCFGGGVLLCTTFLHLLPEVTEKIDNLDYIKKSDIHYAELLMCIGFFTMYFVEECVHLYLHQKKKNKQIIMLERSLSIRLGDSEVTDKKDNSKSLENPIINCDKDNKQHVNHHVHKEHDHGHDHEHFIVEDSTIKAIRGLLIVLALSVHELFEGLAVGLEESSKNVWYMFGAVSAHKLVIAFCIGFELVSSGMTTCIIIVYIFTFAVVSPCGIGIGILVTSNGDSDNTELPSVILQGLASGTLLYVVFFEILRTDRKSGLRQFLAVLCGFIVMLSLSFLE